MSEGKKADSNLRQHFRSQIEVSATEFSEDAMILEAEATAEMLLMTPGFETPPPVASDVAEPPTAQLVRTVLAGGRDRFAGLYEMYSPMVHGILLARVPRGEVDDLVQDIFLHALRKLHTLRDAAAFGPWIAMIARNRAMDFYRKSRETVEVTEQMAIEKPPTGTAKEILALIRRLPEAYRETLVLRFVEGMTGPEIAARTGLTPASVRVNLHRGMKQLREKMGVAR
ncbi:MAG: sigma-70 family RNA polymerase sigma factor [Acidobacteriota bacterium]